MVARIRASAILDDLVVAVDYSCSQAVGNSPFANRVFFLAYAADDNRLRRQLYDFVLRHAFSSMSNSQQQHFLADCKAFLNGRKLHSENLWTVEQEFVSWLRNLVKSPDLLDQPPASISLIADLLHSH